MTTSLDLLKAWVGSPPGITDAMFQSLLDAHALQVQAPLGLTADADGLTFRAPVQGWLVAALTDATGQTVTAATADLAAGVWTFTTKPQAPLAVMGTTADLHAAAADGWTLRLAQANTWKGEFAKTARDMVRYHQARSQPTNVQGVRDDLEIADTWYGAYGPQGRYPNQQGTDGQ